ncbi:SDR family NAD(P)-dependent oxidoreductase [Streptomyces sp. INA 01156]
MDETSPDDRARMFAVNARGVFNVAKAGTPYPRRAGGGAIVAVTSQVGLVGAPRLSAYCAAQAAVIGFVLCLAVDHSHEGIRVSTVCPGITGWTGTFERTI